MGRRIRLDAGAARRAVFAVLALVLLDGCGQTRDQLQFSGLTMATRYTVTIVDPRDLNERALKPEIDAVLATINRIMSTYDPDSELSRLNANPSTDWIPVSAPLYAVLSAADQISRESGGAFDVTVGPLVNLWGFGPEKRGPVPEAAAIREVLQRVGHTLLELRAAPRAIRKQRADVTIDLSGIAKGYAVDEIARLLAEHDVADYLVEIGGEIRARGRNPAGEGWQIGIESPVSDARAIAQVVSLFDTGMASSGTYRNYFERDGVRYSHMIDPTSGYPVAGNLAGVTVIHDSAMQADAWATALMTLGSERAWRLAERDSIPALFFTISADSIDSRANAAFDLAIGHK